MNATDLARAACRNQATREHDPWAGETAADVAEAAAVCARCPVAAACAIDGAGEEHLVWGGVLRTPLPDDVMVVAEAARIRVTVQAVHGSRGLYASGCRCRPCTDANARYIAGYRNDGPAVTRERTIDLQIPLFEGALA